MQSEEIQIEERKKKLTVQKGYCSKSDPVQDPLIEQSLNS